MTIRLPANVNFIIEKLNTAGFKAYAVGGCVRDAILGLLPYDWDITTSALPMDIKALFPRTIDTGIKHGTVTVLLGGEPYEVTTYRIDGDYEDNRRPKSVTFTSDVTEDLKRRDFTINAMAYNEEEGMLDVFGGVADLKIGIIRCVGNATERFNEDALRMLRAVRFSAKLGFEIEKETQMAIKTQAHLINQISAERIHMELTKTLMSDHPDWISNMVTLGLMEYILPEFMPNIGVDQKNPYHIYTIDRHIYETLKHCAPSQTLRWTMLLHDIGKSYCKTVDAAGIGHFYGHTEKSLELSRNILNRLKFDNKTKGDILKLIHYHDYRIEPQIRNVRRALNQIGEELFPSYLEVQRADIMGQNPEYREENMDKLERIRMLYEQILQSRQCVSLKELKINGRDLVAMGIAQGQQIGQILHHLLEDVLDHPEHNDRGYLIEQIYALLERNSFEQIDRTAEAGC